MAISIASSLQKIWQHPLSKQVDTNSADTLEIHRQIIQSKPILKHQYVKWYNECLKSWNQIKHLDGPAVEIGCGSGFLKEFIPEVIRTDNVKNPYADRLMDAMHLEFGDGEVKALFLVCVLHHVQDPEKFLHEAVRCLKPGGRLVMIEPHNSILLKALAKVLHHYEYWDDTVKDWTNRSSDRMTNANLALPWVIFFRDRVRFEKEFPSLKIKRIEYNNFLLYLCSGGMSYRSFLPSFFLPFLDAADKFAGKYMRGLCNDMVIDIEKV